MESKDRSKKTNQFILIAAFIFLAISIWIINWINTYIPTAEEVYYFPFIEKNKVWFYLISSICALGLFIYSTTRTLRQENNPKFYILRFLFSLLFIIVVAFFLLVLLISSDHYSYLDTETFEGNTYHLILHHVEFDIHRFLYLGKCTSFPYLCEFQRLPISIDYQKYSELKINASESQLLIADNENTFYSMDAEFYICDWRKPKGCWTLFGN